MTVRALFLIFAIGFSGHAAFAAPEKPRAPATIPAVNLPTASDARIGGDDKQTRFILDLSQKVDLRAFVLADPYRVVVDLTQVNFALPAGTGEQGRGLIKAFRYGLVMAGGSRIVLDVAKPVKIEKAFALEAKDGQPARLVLELAATDRETFLKSVAAPDRTPPARKTERETPQAAGDPRPMIVIDPGHGGIDSGTHAANGEVEKTLVLDFAVQLRDRLEKTGKYRVSMTRTEDVFVPLAERVKIARARQAQLFISIHADALAASEGDAQGATVYTMSDTASDSQAARLAEAENKADVIAGIDLRGEPDEVADILADLWQRETKSFAARFARGLVGEMKTAMRLHKNPLKSAGFKVLRAHDVPSVLVELGYMSNRDDLKQLTSAKWRAKAVESMGQAVDAFFQPKVAGAAP